MVNLETTLKNEQKSHSFETWPFKFNNHDTSILYSLIESVVIIYVYGMLPT